MPIEIFTFVLGALENNTYLVADTESRAAAVVDPAFEPGEILAYARENNWQIRQIWLTHAHFDHFAGVEEIASAFAPPLPVGLHPADLDLWRSGGGAHMFGLKIERGPEPTISFYQGQRLHLGSSTLEVRHAPGHSQGHVVFYYPGLLLCGDVIFQAGIGRTDLPGGNLDTLLHSIRTQVFTLPADTRLLSGHGPETTIGAERDYLA